MKITALKTHKITINDNNLLQILDKYVTDFQDKSVLVIASKIVAITQGRVLHATKEEKDELIKKEADYYLLPEENDYKLFITIKDNHLTYSAGMDESNSNGFIVLWPQDVQHEVNLIREYLIKRFNLNYAGVIITDMSAFPMQRGVIAGPIAYSGFLPLHDLTNTDDLFGRKFNFTKQGVLQGLAVAAGVVMGEGTEQTPLAIIEEVPFVEFQDRNPTKVELESLFVSPEQDIFGVLIKAVNWKKGGTSKNDRKNSRS
jgi:F420-0:gamma-glutamyl ligase